jgi:hypothetical protein
LTTGQFVNKQQSTSYWHNELGWDFAFNSSSNVTVYGKIRTYHANSTFTASWSKQLHAILSQHKHQNILLTLIFITIYTQPVTFQYWAISLPVETMELIVWWNKYKHVVSSKKPVYTQTHTRTRTRNKSGMQFCWVDLLNADNKPW